MKNFIITSVVVFAFNAHAEIQTETIEYKAGNTVLQGYVAYDAKLAAKRPGIVIVHDWMGMSPFVKKKAEELAALGYTAFAADIFGKGVAIKDTKQAGENAGLYKNDRRLLRERVQAAYDQLQQHKTVKPGAMAAMGYCFGGMTALELARAGTPLTGVISFHGNLDTPNPADAKNIKGELLILHGADDPWVPLAQIADFEKEMKAAKVRYRIEKYPGAVHAFTNPESGNDPAKGAAYNAEADRKSNAEMRSFLARIFKKKEVSP